MTQKKMVIALFRWFVQQAPAHQREIALGYSEEDILIRAREIQSRRAQEPPGTAADADRAFPPPSDIKRGKSRA
ncbi:hypothetical protein LLG95_12920 [bacterium]|nr:hypothetical protein [bacterium]